MMALGAITLIALILPGQGALTDWWRDSIAPWFETGRWLLPFLLLGGGWYVAGGPGRAPGSGWGMTITGLAIAYIASLGAFEVLKVELLDTERGGGRIGRFLAGTLEPLLTGPGTFVLLAAIAVLGLMLAFNLQLRELIAPMTGAARWVGTTTADSMKRASEARPSRPTDQPEPASKAAAVAKSPVAVPMVRTDDLAAARSILDEPAPRMNQSPVSQTVWTGPLDGGTSSVPAGLGR
jgi:4TM region of DNA translocase FtsK/SpoIIIE